MVKGIEKRSLADLRVEYHFPSQSISFKATIPASEVTTQGVEYYIEAKDANNNISYHGSIANPHSITVGYPVLLVHGLNSNSVKTWQTDNYNFYNNLKNSVGNVFTIDLIPPNYKINELAKQLSGEIDVIKRKTNAPKVDLVCHSMGGLVSRWYTRFSNHNSVRKLIMIDTPNHGSELLEKIYCFEYGYFQIKTPLGILISNKIGDPYLAGAQMLCGSVFLNQLNHDSLFNLWWQKDKLASNVEHHTIAGTDGYPILSILLLGEDDGIVRVKSVKLDDVPNTEVPYHHLNETENSDVFNIVTNVLKGIPLPQSAPLKAPLSEEIATLAQYLLPAVYGTISQSETKSHNIPVDSTITGINFLLGWEGGNIGLTLTSPDGTLITSTSSTGSITYFNASPTAVEGYTIDNPQPGTWTMNINANNVSGIGTYSAETLVETTLILSLSTDKSLYNPNAPFHITGMLTNNNIPITGASVTLRIITPTGTDTFLILYDDGTNGDIQANDGTYTNTFTNTNMNGSYVIVATAVGNINNEPFVRQAHIIIQVEQFPDLTLSSSDITFSNDTPTQGEEVTINTTIHNIGDIGATDTTIFFYDGLSSEAGILIGSKTISYISVGGSEEVSVIWTVTSGTHTIQVIISPYNSFLEKSYDNNSASKEILVSSPDLAISSTDISFYPSCPASGEMVTITAIVYNTGTIKADSVVVGFFIGNPLGTGTEIGSQTITTIFSNGSQTTQFLWNTTGYTGMAQIYVYIDPQNKIAEANKTNNLTEKMVYIQEPDTLPPTNSITNPADNSIVSGIIDISADADDNVGVTKVEFYINNTQRHIDITPPYNYSWNTTQENNGSSTINVVAYDSSNLTNEKHITVMVDNPVIDTTPPGTITNLQIGSISATSIMLIWIAPGDDGYIGTATLYDIRYATFTITEDTWSLASQVLDTPKPKMAGLTETFIISELQPKTTYYMAIKSQDDEELWSGLSNVASFTTTSLPITSISHNATNSLGVGKTFTVTMVGEPNNFAVFSISGMATTTMTEVSPGTYTGNYTVQEGDNITGTLTGYLTIGTQTYSIEDGTVVIDGIRPQTTTLVCVINPAQDGKLNLLWTLGTETDLAGFRIYYGTEAGIYTNSFDTGTIATVCTLSSLTNGVCYYIAISAYDKAGNEGGKSNEGIGTPTAQLSRIEIEAATTTIRADDILTLYLKGYDNGNILIGYTPGTFSISPNLGNFNPTYGTKTIFDAIRQGMGTITATDGAHTDTVTITVTHGTITALSIEPQTAILTSDGSLTLTAVAQDNDGNTWTTTQETTFTEDDPLGTMSANIYYPGKVGTWTITGTYSTLVATATVTVTPGAFTKFTIDAPTSTTTNATFSISVGLTDADGNPYSGTVSLSNITKSISPTEVTLISGSRTFEATITTSPNGGTDTITVTLETTMLGTRTIIVYLNTLQGTVTFGGTQTAMIEFGTGSLGTSNVTVSISTSTTSPTSPPSGISFAGVSYNIELKDENNQPYGTQSLPGSVTIYLSYSEQGGYVTGTRIKEGDLKIYLWDDGIWTTLQTTVNGTENYAFAPIPHFSTFTLGGTPTITFTPTNNAAFAYPSPWKKGDAKYGGRYIYFANVSEGSTIRIYSIVGELIDEIIVTECPQKWDIQSKNLASGIYIYCVTGGGGGKKIGKFGVIK
ncbi:MAG: CARDB domain-containing protein [bacterium]